MKALRIVAAGLAALLLLQVACLASAAAPAAAPEDEYYPSFGHLEDEDEQPALMEEQTSSERAAERSEAEAQMGVEYWGAPTTFVSTNHPYPLPPVMYDSCGRPLCPAKPAPLPPRAYICDCRRPKEHPDCGCDRDTMQCGCETENPHWRCGCNIRAQPVAIVCDCNSEEDPHPACGCNRLPRRRKHVFKPYLPSSGMHYLPPLSTDECRPNVLEYGPGNCLSTGEETDDFCSSSDSNCQTPAVQPVCRSRDCQRSNWAREAYCQCREPAPAPCECQRPPFSPGAYRRAAFFSRSLPAPTGFGNFGLGPQGAPSPDAECMCLGEPKCSCDPSQWQDNAGAYPYPYANNNQSPYYYGAPSGSGSGSSYPSANICPCLGRPACGCAPPPPSTCPCPGTGAPRCPCVQWQEDPYVRPPPNIYDNRRYRHRRFWHRRDSCKCEGRPNCMCARQVDSLCGCTGQPNCGCSVATTPQCGCAGQSGCPCSSMAAPPPPPPPPAAPLAPFAPSPCGCMGQPNCGCQQQQQQPACGCMGQPNCGCGQQQMQSCGCTGQPNCVCSQQIPPCPCVGQKNCTCEEAFKAAQMAAALSYVYQQTKVSGSPYAVNPLTGQSMLTTPFTQPNDLKATDGGSSMIMHTAGTIYDAQGRSVPINPAKIIIEPTILFRHADGTLHSTPQPPRAKPGVNPDALPSSNDLLTGPNDAELRRQEEQLRDEEKDIKREMIKEQEIQEKHKQKLQSENEFEQKEKADVAAQSADLIKRLREKRTADELTEFASQQKADKRKKKDQAIKAAAANVNLNGAL